MITAQTKSSERKSLSEDLHIIIEMANEIHAAIKEEVLVVSEDENGERHLVDLANAEMLHKASSRLVNKLKQIEERYGKEENRRQQVSGIVKNFSSNKR